jgi:hypothetical protein
MFCAPTGDARAAVRICKPVAASPLVAGDTELAARKGALDAWKALALAHGEEYASWRLAADKFLHCLPSKGGGFECMARAAPCTIDQAPARRELRQKRMGI